jgi:hypothetical protein
MFNYKLLLVMLICICLSIIYFTNKYEHFNINKNLFFQPIDNIFLADNYYNYELNYPDIKHKTDSLENIKFNSYLYSKPTSQKIICASHKDRANCWSDNVNNCQWVYKIDGDSYCNVAPIWLL